MTIGCERSSEPGANPVLSGLDSKALSAKEDDGKGSLLPKGLALGGSCPDAGPDAQADMARQASAPIPLEQGLTLSNIWIQAGREFEFECLTQVTRVDAREIEVTLSCPEGRDHAPDTSTRKICRVDLKDAYLYMPAGRADAPDVILGSTMFSLSQKSFRQLKSGRNARHRRVELRNEWQGFARPLQDDTDGTFGTTEQTRFSIIVNDQLVEMPALRSAADQVDGPVRTIATVLDDERFPLMLQYEVPSSLYSIRYSKVSFPTVGEIEKHLAAERRVDVYGIYFDFASDRIRAESEPVLGEIAKALADHPDWELDLDGHTDNIGGADPNLDLSERRAAAVRQALVSRYSIAGTRLTTHGFGASRPKATNDTLEGRARNRRVELVRK
jgi:outer membrane protein OmpA-like peptidoglycan-associated protein